MNDKSVANRCNHPVLHIEEAESASLEPVILANFINLAMANPQKCKSF